MAANVLTVGDITKGKIVATDLLRTFITYLIVGPDVKCRNSMSKNRKIDSIYQNFVFATRTGKKETRTKFASRSGYQKYF